MVSVEDMGPQIEGPLAWAVVRVSAYRIRVETFINFLMGTICLYVDRNGGSRLALWVLPPRHMGNRASCPCWARMGVSDLCTHETPVRPRGGDSNPIFIDSVKRKKARKRDVCGLLVAESEGFEPSVSF